jgi:hypothetical protein
MIVRAGILYGLCTKIADINHVIIADVLYLNKILSTVIEFSYYKFIKSQYQAGEVPDRRKFFIKNDVFVKHFDKIQSRFLQDGYTEDEIISMITVFSDVKQFCTNEIVIDEWVYSDDRPGMLYETIAIDNLTKLGFEIYKPESKSVIIDGVQINGRPDGMIISSPGNVYNPGTVVEIKYKHRRQRYRSERDELQMCAYGLIFNTDVLYVIIYNDNNMECKLIKRERLLEIWNEKRNTIISNCKYLGSLIKDFETDENKMEELINLAKRN